MQWRRFVRVTERVLFLACLMLSASRQGWAGSIAPAASMTVASAGAGARLVAASEEKKRVPKPAAEPPRFKADTSGSSSSSYSSDEDESWTSQCIGECLGNIFSSMCSALVQSIGSSAGRRSGAPWAVGDRAELSAGVASDSVTLRESWDGADETGTRLAAGDRVVVLETLTAADGVWLRVRPVDRLEPVGWVRQSSAWRTAAEAAARRLPPRSAEWGLRVAAGGGGVGPAELNVEYRNGGYRLDVEYLRTSARHFQWGAGAGFRHAAGHPAVLYITPATVEDPQRSRLWIVDLGVRSGHRYALGSSGLEFDWLLGPTLAYVHEWSELRVHDAATRAFIEKREDSLGRWAGGGDLRLALGTSLRSGPEIALVADAYVLAWRGQATRSLSSDFVRKAIHGFDVALAITFAGR